jgi:hypothetical protein
VTPFGVWVCYYFDIGPIVESIHWDEMAARRAAGQDPGANMYVKFVEFDKEFRSQVDEHYAASFHPNAYTVEGEAGRQARIERSSS